MIKVGFVPTYVRGQQDPTRGTGPEAQRGACTERVDVYTIVSLGYLPSEDARGRVPLGWLLGGSAWLLIGSAWLIPKNFDSYLSI